MRNLKKFLALVLALMMTFSLMVTANAAIDTNAAVTDKDSITEEFKEAVAVLNGLKIITGYEDGTFRPDKPISRQEATALVYRLHSGDADNVKKDLYSTADNIAKFKDVNPNGGQQWSAGYIGYCANQEIIKGVGADRFNPTGNVTGYQMLAMVLRAIGYGQRGEYEGSGWQTRVATTATQLGMLKNIDDTNYAGTLSAPATRELVAEIVFQAALLDQVIWNDAFGYVSKNQITGLTLESLGVEKFDLKCSTYRVIDKWGRPGYYWFQGSTVKSDLSNVVATIKALPVKTYDTTVRECDVAHDLDIATNATYSLYVNRNTAITDSYRIEATDTVTKVGGQGRITEFYGNLTNEHNGSTWSKSVVMIDTYLATVTRVTERVVDPAGHEIVPAYLYLDVHDGHGVGAANKTTGTTQNTTEHRVSKNGGNWEYTVGEKVLLNGYTDYTQGLDAGGYTAGNTATNTTGLNHTFSQSEKEQAAFETNRLGSDDTKINVLGKAEYKTGKQTVTYWNSDKHTVDGADYNDQLTLFLDVAGTTTNTTFAWYFDAKGNLIGIDNVPNTVSYGVITSIYSAFNQGESATDGTAKAIAKVLYADGTEGTISIDRFLMSHKYDTNASLHGNVDTQMVDQGKGHTVGASHALSDNKATVELVPVYDNSGDVMVATQRGDNNTKIDNALSAGWLHVAPVIGVNAVENGSNAKPYFGILRGNMFKFVASADGDMTAIEVAGHKDATPANHATAENTGIFEWNYNNIATTGGNGGRIYKSYAYITLNTADASRTSNIWMDADTRIMVRDANDLDKVNAYTLSTLPGDVTFAADSEIDWADPDGDGRADYVYVTGTVQGTVTYGLFYYNGGAAQWNGVEKTGTAFGWLNGEPTTVNFDNETEFNLIRDSQAYAGHLFALQLTNGVVSNVMYSKNETHTSTFYNRYILTDESAATPANTSGTLLKLAATPASDTTATNLDVASDHTTNSVKFEVGTKGGNPYGLFTQAIYLEDVAPDATKQSVSYDPSTRTIIVWTDDGTTDGIMQTGEIDATYYLVPGSKVIGLGMGVNQESAILDYLNKSTTNDVTIVFEESTTGVKSIVEIYVATDPNNTPNSGVASGVGADVGSVSAPTAALVDSALNNLAPNVGAPGKAYTSAVPGGKVGNSDPEDVLYIPFTAGATNKATINIFDASGTLVYTEDGTVTAGAKTHVVFNFAVAAKNAGTMTAPLSAGTYTFYINEGTAAAPTTLLTSGIFTLV